MKQKSLLVLLLIALFAPVAMQAQTVTIGEGTSANNYNPIATYYNYSFTEQLYLASEINQTGSILSLGFNYASSNSKDFPVQIYMKAVDATSLTSAISIADSDLVFNGTLSATAGWVTVELDTPFAYNGTQNLLIAVNRGYVHYFSGNTWYFTSTDNMACNAQNDGNAYTPTSSLPTTSATDYRPNVQLTFGTPPTCPKPTLSQDVTVTENSATIAWTPSSESQTLFDIYWSTENTAPTESTTPSAANQSGTSYNITGLTASTQYYAWIRGNCGTATEPDITGGWTAAVPFITNCAEITIPYTYGFEEEGPFSCWTPIAGAARQTRYVNNGSYSLIFSGTTNNMIALPQFTEATNTLRLEFWTRPESNNSSCGYFAVGYMTDLTDASTFVALATYAYSDWSSLTFVKKSVDFNVEGVPADAYIAMRQYNCSTYYFWFVDDVTVMEAPSCVKPSNIATNNITTNSAELSWTANSGETAWTVYYKKSSDTDYTSVAATTNPYTLENLDVATTYEFYVVANCSATDQSEASEVYSFTTECEIFSAYPYTENFDSYNVPNAYNPFIRTLPTCWSAINTTTHSSYAAYPSMYYYSYDDYANSAPNCLRFYSYYASYYEYDPQPQYAILPEMENLAGKQITLSAKGYNASSTFKIGTMTDPTDVSTFVEITEQALTTSYQELIYYVPADATANYIAIMIDAANEDRTANSVVIDDITIDNPPACPKPTELAVSDVTAHTAQLSWTSNADAWQICLNEDEENLITANANPFSLTGLAENTSYTAKVRAVCDGVPGDWSGTSVNFTTPLACPAPTGLAVSNITGHEATLTWTGTSEGYDVMYRTSATADGLFENFVSSPSDWTRYSGLMEYVLTDSIELSENSSYWAYDNYNGVFDKHARINIYGTNVRNWLVSPSIELPEGATFSFDLALTKYNGTLVPVVDSLQQDDKFVVLISNDDMNTWNILRQWDNAGSEYVFNNIACSATGEQVSLDVSAYVGQNVRIAFYGESTSSADNNGGDNNMHIDNILVGLPISAGEWQTLVSDTTAYTLTGLIPETDYEVKVVSSCEGETGHETDVSYFTTDVACPAPIGLAATEVTPTSVNLVWTSAADAWQIQLNEEEPIDVTENPYTLEGLDPETEYTVMVRANCGEVDGYSEWSEATIFTTLEGCPVPTDVEVNDITYNSANLAWTGYTDSYNITYQSAATINSIFSEDFSGDIDDWTLKDCAGSTGLYYGVFRFSWNTNPPQYLISPEITGITEDATLEFTYYNHSASWEETFQVGLSSTDNATDSFTWSETITANDGEEHTYHATVPAGTKYMAIKLLSNDKYYLYIDDIVIGSDIPAGDPITVTSEEESATLTDLTPNTEYEVKVQGVCGETETEWTETLSFTTLTPSFTKDIVGYGEGNGNYYLIASPIGEVDPTEVTNMTENEFDLYAFDQSQNAAEWQNYEDTNFVLEPGKGYLYANSTDVTLTFNGEAYDGTGDVTLVKNDNATLSGWNLVGNPFAETAYLEVPFYTMNPDGSEIVAAETEAIAAMEGVFVIAETDGETLSFSTTAPDNKGSRLALNLSQGRGTIDRAIVRFDEGRTLPKFQLRENSTKLYIPQDGHDYAVVRSEGMGELPVSFKAKENGSYTISYSMDNVEFSYLHLIDNLTGADVDLLAQPSYSFEANASDDTSRFTLIYATDSSAITLSQGWSWFSSNVEFTNRLLSQLENGVAANSSSGIIKSQNSGFVTYDGGAWTGSLSELNIEEMYLIASNGGDLTLYGALVDPEDHPITLNNGWNWIGFLSDNTMTVTEAMAGITPNENDMIKGQLTFSTYNGNSWIPEIAMVPGQGYLYLRSGESTTLVYPSTSKGVAETTPAETYWNADHHAFPTNLTMMVTLDENIFGMAEGSHEIGAFVDDECRGSARLTNVDGQYVAFLTVSGQDAETVSFRLYDVTSGTIYGTAEESINYKSDEIYGNVESPMVLHFRNTGLDEFENAVSLFPNPAKDKILVSGNGIQTLKVYNAMGQLLHAEECANAEQVTLNLGNYSAGVYTVSIVTADGKTVNKKMVKE